MVNLLLVFVWAGWIDHFLKVGDAKCSKHNLARCSLDIERTCAISTKAAICNDGVDGIKGETIVHTFRFASAFNAC